MDEYYTAEGNLPDRRRVKYAVVAFLPKHLNEIVTPFRERYDPDFNSVSSHITIVFPFDSNRPLEELADVVRAETQDQKTIRVQLDTIGDFYPSSPVIYWNVRQNAQLSELYFRLHASLGLPIPYKAYKPHVTLAREISQHRLIVVKEQIASYLPVEHFYAGTVDLITPLVSGKWVSVRTFPLKGFSENPPAIR